MKTRRTWIFITFTWLISTGLVWAYGVFRTHFANHPASIHRVEELEKEVAALKLEKAKLAFQFEDFRQNAALHWPEARKKDYRWPASANLDLSSPLYEKGRKLFQEKKYDESLETFEKIISDFPYSKWIAESYYYQCETQFHTRDYKNFSVCVGQMTELFPDNPLTGFQLLRLAQTHEMHGQDVEAEELYRIVRDQFAEPILKKQAQSALLRLE